MSKGFLEGIGVAQLLSIAVANGETSKVVAIDDQGNANYKVFLAANYAASALVTVKTRSSFTVTFVDPTADKVIDALVIHG